MAIAHQAHRQRIEAGLGFEWDRLPPQLKRASDADPDATELNIQRVGASHAGVGRLRAVRKIWASSVNQAFLEELGSIQGVEMLYLNKVTATDLSPLRALGKLRSLTVIGATKVKDLSWLPADAPLEALLIEGMKAVSDLSSLAGLRRLTALGVEGSMWTPMRVKSLRPLARLEALESLFITNLRVEDQSLKPLHALTRLKVLQCARFFPRTEFMELAKARPTISCTWFDEARWNEG